MFDFFYWAVVSNTGSKLFTEADFFAEVNPVAFADRIKLRKGGLAEGFEIIIPDCSDSGAIIIPESAFVFGAVGGDGGIVRVDWARFAVAIKEIRQADFYQNVILLNIFFKAFFVFKDGILKSHAVRTHNIGINNKVIFGIKVSDGHIFVPDNLGIGWLNIHAGNNGGKNYDYDSDNCANSKTFLHEPPFLDIFHL